MVVAKVGCCGKVLRRVAAGATPRPPRMGEGSTRRNWVAPAATRRNTFPQQATFATTICMGELV